MSFRWLKALLVARTLIHTNALPMPQQPFVKIVVEAHVLGEQRLQEGMRILRCDFFSDQPQAPRLPYSCSETDDTVFLMRTCVLRSRSTPNHNVQIGMSRRIPASPTV